MKTRIILLVCMLLILSGCSEVPQQVKENMEKNARQGQTNVTESKEYDTFENVLRTAPDALKGEYQNLILPKRITLPEKAELSEIQLKGESSYRKYMNDMLFLGFTKEESKHLKTVKKKDDIGEYYEIDQKKNLLYSNFDDSGNVTFSIGYFYNHSAIENQFVEIFHVDRGEKSTKEYSLLSGKMSIAEAIDMSEKWVKTKWKRYSPDLVFRVKTVAVFLHKKKNKYIFQVKLEGLYNGIPLDEMAELFEQWDGQDPKRRLHCFPTSISVEIGDSKRIGSFAVEGEHTVYSKKSLRTDKFVTLQHAIKIVENKLSAFRSYKIDDIDITYILGKKQGDTSDSPPCSKPVWAFVIDDQQALIDPDKGDGTWPPRHYFLVEMETGEVIVDESILQGMG